ncbi:BLUF domain-containing protein [Vibrio ichthyoenteri ATCC 700023]|uniref:BLUF domain-containing protein n=1 Tax=Vibrio ichthyoenteri ATCC 700023 TaxID=870968 RepID=F9S3C4_9VIBR|nr:BLUF domain-containing protein [Vibrio ichthyoenteri]EGU38148.1 BLUF domain-containing protein [Vibrio ichthyoenteri ATCC 700023]
MKCILYRSDSTLGKIDIQSLLTSATEKNAQLDITGFLMSHSGGFIQYIKGTNNAIDGLYAAISSDPRHSNVTILFESEISQRMYQEWNMGHVYIADDSMIEMLKNSDGLQWFEYLKQRTLFLYPNEFNQQHSSS